jgi:hypothetical protein
VKDCAPHLPIDFESCRDPTDIMAVETEERRQPLLLKRPRLLAVRTRAAGDNDWRTAEPATDSVRAYGPAAPEPLSPSVACSISCLGTKRSLRSTVGTPTSAFGGRMRLSARSGCCSWLWRLSRPTSTGNTPSLSWRVTIHSSQCGTFSSSSGPLRQTSPGNVQQGDSPSTR